MHFAQAETPKAFGPRICFFYRPYAIVWKAADISPTAGTSAWQGFFSARRLFWIATEVPVLSPPLFVTAPTYIWETMSCTSVLRSRLFFFSLLVFFLSPLCFSFFRCGEVFSGPLIRLKTRRLFSVIVCLSCSPSISASAPPSFWFLFHRGGPTYGKRSLHAVLAFLISLSIPFLSAPSPPIFFSFLIPFLVGLLGRVPFFQLFLPQMREATQRFLLSRVFLTFRGRNSSFLFFHRLHSPCKVERLTSVPRALGSFASLGRRSALARFFFFSLPVPLRPVQLD